MTELADLFPYIDDISDPNFQAKITLKKEFLDLKTSTQEAIPSVRGQLFKHQEMFKNYMKFNDRICVIADPGTGKTCTVSGLAEYYADHVGETPIKKTYILVHSPAIENEIRNQIVCRCSSGKYENKNAKDSKSRERGITTALQKWYKIISYVVFGNMIRENYSVKREDKVFLDYERIRADFSGCIFWMDEVHELRISRDVMNIDDSKLKQKELTYKTLWKVFHTVDRCKFIETTATPMVNNTRELGPELNLILPEDKQFPFNYNFDNATIEELNNRLSGMISYVRALDTGIVIVPGLGDEPIGGEGIDEAGNEFTYTEIVHRTKMSPLQEACYLSYRGQINEDDGDDDDETGTGGSGRNDVYSNVRQATNFVYPDGTIGDAPFKKYINYDSKSGIYSAKPELQRYLINLDGPESISTLSSKYADTIRRARVTRGCYFAHSDLRKYSGIIQFGLCLEAQGYTMFSQNSSAFDRSDFQESSSYCGDGMNDKKGDRKLLIKPGLRYAIISSDTTQSRSLFSSIMELFNSKENRYGDYIKFILVTMVGRTGISFNNVISIELFDAFWNKSSNKQTKMRSIRATSHNNLIKDREAQGIFGPLPVGLYQHVAVTSRGESINIYMYKVAEKKERPIAAKMRMLKQISFDCWLNHDRNVRPGDTDGSELCDYTTCNYDCYNPNPLVPGYTIDESSFDVLYIDGIVNTIVNSITSLFSAKSSWEIERFYKYLGYPIKYIDLAIEQIVFSKRPIMDRFGFNRYPHQSSGWLYLSDTFDQGKVMDTFYIENLIINEKRDLVRGSSKQISSVEDILTASNLTLRSEKQQFEQALIEYSISGIKQPILYQFQNFWFEVPEPVIMLRDERASNLIKSRKSKLDIKTLKPAQLAMIDFEPNNRKVIFNNYDLYDDVTMKSGKSGLIQNYHKGDSKYRILDSGRFRDMDSVERFVYNKLFQKSISLKVKPLEDTGIYIIKMKDSEIIVRKFADTDDVSIKEKNRGRDCSSLKKNDIYDIVRYINLPIQVAETLKDFSVISNLYTLTDAELSKVIDDREIFDYEFQNERRMSREQKINLILWDNKRLSNVEMCKYISTYLKERGLIFTIY